MKSLIIAALLGSSALAAAALAQETTTPDAAAKPMEAPNLEGGFITWRGPDQMIASNIIGADVRSAEEEVIGDVDDLLLDREGEVIGVLVGIGGFLGIGERNVAIPEDKLEYVLARESDTQEMGVTTGAPDQPGMDSPGADGTEMPGDVANGAGSPVDGAGTSAMEGAGSAGLDHADNSAMDGRAGTDPGTGTVVEPSRRGLAGWTGSRIDHIRVSYTRAELEDAPAFEAMTQ